MLMTVFINDLYDFKDPKSREKLLQLFEALMLNGGELIIVQVAIKIVQLMKDQILSHLSFDVIVYCQQNMLIECFKDDQKWAQI